MKATKLKRFLAAALVGVMSLSLVACGEQERANLLTMKRQKQALM